MSRVFTIAPLDGWQSGDKVFCVRGTDKTTPSLETGKAYRVQSALKLKGMVQWCLGIEGVSLPEGYGGVSSGRFVKLREGRRPLDEIYSHTTSSWLDAYRASVGQSPHPDSI